MTLRSFDDAGWASRIMGEVFHPKHLVIITQRLGETPRFKKRDNVLKVDKHNSVPPGVRQRFFFCIRCLLFILEASAR